MEHSRSGESDASSGEEPNAKKCKRDPNAQTHAKSVVVLFDSDVTVGKNSKNVVLMPNTIEMAKLKKPDKGQYGKIFFTSEMTQMDVLTALQFKFPILRNKRLACASAADNRTRLDFHGDKRIWSGALINRHTRGNSALYVLAEENHESEESQVLLEGQDLAASRRLKRLSQMSSTADQRHLTVNHDEGVTEMLQRGRVELTTQADHTTGGISVQQGLSVVQHMQNDPFVKTIADPGAQASLKPVSMTSGSQERTLFSQISKQGSSLQKAPPAAAAAAAAAHSNVPVGASFPQTTSTMKSSVNKRKRKSHSNGHQEFRLPLAVSEGETTDSGIDSTLEFGSNHDTVQFRATQENAQNSEPESSLQLALSPPAPAAHKNVPVQVFKQDTSSNERKRKDSPQKNPGFEALPAISEGEAEDSSTESMWRGSTNLDNFTSQLKGIVGEICPNKGSIKGGDRFHLILGNVVPKEIESFKAIFQGGGEVYLEKASLCTLAGKTPGSKHGPGKVRVTLMSSDESWWGGECDFLYIEDPPTRGELLNMVVKNIDMWDEVCDMMIKEISGSKPSDGQTSNSSGKTAPGSSSYAWSVKLLQLLVYKAAEIDGQEFIRMIFSTSAGKVIFNSYRNSATLPEYVARTNGHLTLAYYLQDVNSRFSKESNSDAGTESIDWLEMKHAVDEEQCLTSGTDEPQILKERQPLGYPESNDDESDYFADSEISPSLSPCHSNVYDSENEAQSQNSKVIESSCEQEVNEEDNLPVENDDSSELPLHLRGNQLEVIPSMKAENAGYKHKQLDSDDVESYSSGDDITEKEHESAVPCHGEVENWDTLRSEVISEIEEVSTGTASSHTATHKCHNAVVTYGSESGLDEDQRELRMIDNDENSRSRDFANRKKSPTENSYRFFDSLAIKAEVEQDFKGEVLVVDLPPENGSKETPAPVEPGQSTHANNSNRKPTVQVPEQQLKDLYNDLRVQAANDKKDSSVQDPAEHLRDQDFDDASVHRRNNDEPPAEAPGGETHDERADPNDVLLQDSSGCGSRQGQDGAASEISHDQRGKEQRDLLDSQDLSDEPTAFQASEKPAGHEAYSTSQSSAAVRQITSESPMHPGLKDEISIIKELEKILDDVRNHWGIPAKRKTSIQDVTAYSSALKASIRRQSEFQTKSAASSTISSVKTDDIFTNLLIQHRRKPVGDDFHLERKKFHCRCGQVSETHQVKHCREIFVPTNGKDSNPKSILLTGKAGIGKTLFSQKLIQDWSDDKLFQVNTEAEVPDFKFAYFLTFRQLNLLGDDPVTLREILNRSSELDDHSIIDESLFEYMANHPEEVLIIMDGFDEYSQKDYITSHLDEKYPNSAQEKMPVAALCAKLFKGHILSGSVVITTSRSDESDQLKTRVHFDRFVEITEFSEEQVKEYIEKYFNEDENMKNTVLDHITRNEELVTFAHIPVLCFLMCSCMEYLLKESLSADSLPVKASDLYFEVFNKFVQDHKRKEIPCESTLNKLSELAARLLLEKKFCFVKEDMTNFDLLEVESLRASGILHCGPPFRKSAFEETKDFCFTHLTLQEYFAAHCFVERGEIPSTQKVSSMVMQFMAGILSKKKDNEFMEKLLNVLQAEERWCLGERSIMIKCLAEYEDKDFAKDIIKKHPLQFRTNEFLFLINVDCVSASFLLDVFCELNEEATKEPQPSTEHTVPVVEEFRILDSNLTPSGVRRICKYFEKGCCKVTRLYLSHNHINDAGVTGLSEALQSSACKVTTLNLGCNQITDAGAISLSEALQSSACKVTTLNLSRNQITDAGVISLSQALQSSACKVTTLALSFNQITDAGAISLSEALQSSACKVTKLDLSCNQITDAGVISLSQALQLSACKVTTLDLSGNHITAAGAISLSEALQSSACKVTMVNVSGYLITDAGAIS